MDARAEIPLTLFLIDDDETDGDGETERQGGISGYSGWEG
jgi:hypothetical protein